MLKTDLRKFDNSWYNPGAFWLKRMIWYYTNTFFFNSSFPFYSIKFILLRLFGAKISRNVVIKPRVNIKYPWNLTINENVWIGENVWLDSLGKIHIGSNSCISQGAMLITGNHNYKKYTFDLIIGDILIEEGVWIGAGSVICPGITCYTHSMLTAGSVATCNLESYSIYQGNPAIKTKNRTVSE